MLTSSSLCTAAARQCRRLFALFVLLALAACASLPNVEQALAAPVPQNIEFEGAAGPVSKAKGEVILARIDAQIGDTDILDQHMAHEQAINLDSPLVLGNKLVLLQDGPATYQAMFAAIDAARDHINLETYIIDDDDIGRQFAERLLAKQAQGVQVRLLYDSVGCIGTPAPFFQHLVAGGIQVVEFNPINGLKEADRPWRLNNRDHRKQLIVDGRIAFVGGINISKVYSSGPWAKRHKKKQDISTGWRDTHIQIEGPVVAEFQRLFLATWARQHGPPALTQVFFPELPAQGPEIVRALASVANDPHSPIYLTLISAIRSAQREIHLTIAYFAPDQQLRTALTDAAGRGVAVKLILPSFSDSWLSLHLGHGYYQELLDGGVQIYERRDAVMHAKTASIDGVWSTVGSTNLDWRSFLHNDEINAVVLGRDFARQMEAMFVRDLSQSNTISADVWASRPFAMRLREWLARLGAYWL